ncbi:hypothetical protein DERP_001561 [Dermatophagoides pteronyssinus]|uniref:Uncharacterized protein n=1 Tax=Dermatophagoides pteronyssinus TaxID=6956 RepID=A0ABQ8JAV2_DERPT|nr:hypothetical protein DERP_001561 [Dermatophagoides pteronyssinus]
MNINDTLININDTLITINDTLITINDTLITINETVIDENLQPSTQSILTDDDVGYCPFQYDKEWFIIGIIILILIDFILLICIGYYCCKKSIRRVREFTTTMTEDECV